MGFHLALAVVMKVLIKYSTRTPRFSINAAVGVSQTIVLKIVDKFITYIPAPDFFENKLGVRGVNVQVDETMLNYKCKSHRGRSPTNRTDSLCIIEYVNHITRAYATVIPNKMQSTIVPII